MVAVMKVRFRHGEKFVIEKCQLLITNGFIDGMPVDDRFFRVLCEYFLKVLLSLYFYHIHSI